MAKKKKTTKKAIKKTSPKHSLPAGFWRQTGAVVLMTLGVLLVVAMFGAGGPILEGLLNAANLFFGYAVYLLPALFLYIAFETFKAEGNRLPAVLHMATWLFMIWAAGFMGLATRSTSAVSAENPGGGIIGSVANEIMLSLVNAQVGMFVYIVLAALTSLFIFRVTPKAIFDGLQEMFARETGPLPANAAVAARANAAEPAAPRSNPIGELKVNGGAMTASAASAAPAVAEPKASRLSSLRNSATTDKAAEDRPALTAGSDPTWQAPGLDLLEKKQVAADPGDVKHNAQIIHDTLAEFNIEVEMEGANIGPKVTQYTLRPPSGVKLTRITQLETNIALNLAAQALRIEAPIPGQRAVGIEVPNRKAADVRLHGILSARQWTGTRAPLGFAIGKDIAGDAVVGELDRMPHLLIAGATGSGKSVMINTLLTSLLYRNGPADMKLILVDPKQVEMTPYNEIPHLLTPVITEPEKCISALKWAVNEMERRYTLLAEQKLRNIQSYNELKKDEGMPYIVIVIDELADLMMVAARDVEALIVRLAQKARAVGIHLVLATQRPSVDVITGLIKANVPARIAFTVASQVDSRTILDQVGAEKLLGQGDMLMLTPQLSKPKRIQGAFVSDDEVIKITDHIRMQRQPEYNDEITAQPVQLNGKGGVVMDADGGSSGEEGMYKDAVRCVIEAGKASTSLLQRRLRIGYSRAARLIETMEEQGIIGPADGARPRDVLVSSLDDVFGGQPGDLE